MFPSYAWRFSTCFIFISSAFVAGLADPIKVTIPKPPKNNAVQSSFLGVSIELSFLNEYFGDDTSSIPNTMINYLTALRSRMGQNHLKIRIGGNSMDSSDYVPEQTTPMVQLIGGYVNFDDQPVKYGPMLWDVMKQVASKTGGIDYLIGLSLLDPNSTDVPLVAGDAQEALGQSIDAFLLGNEVDLYTKHGDRPKLQNYTTADYITVSSGCTDYETATERLTNTSAGGHRHLAGPTICCNWDLGALLNGGYLATFDNILKYITLQHYPQNDCTGAPRYGISYYMQHANVVNLASWQKPGIDILTSNTSADRPGLILSEFNSASCGGLPNISDTFAVGSLWTIDYALQLASVGYNAAYLHTRERGISYNIVAPPEDSNGPWATGANYYALLVTAEALQSSNGSVVVDLNVGESMTDLSSTVGGYAVYEALDSTVQQVVLLNFASSGTATFSLPPNTFSSSEGNNVTVKYLTASSADEKINISWGAQTLAGVGNGEFIGNTAAWGAPNKELDCTDGCLVDVPAPAVAVVFANNPSLRVATIPTGTAPAPAPKQTQNTGVTPQLYATNKIYTLLVATLVGLI